jgi:hypothetical protein
MIINLMWLVVIAVAAVIQWAIIEKKMRVPDKGLWFGIRVVTAGIFTLWYWEAGQYIVWSVPYMITTFAWIFPLLLNWFRGKKLGYMSAKGSKYDAFILKYIHRQVYFYMTFILFLIGTGMQLIYNYFSITSWAQLW